MPDAVPPLVMTGGATLMVTTSVFESDPPGFVAVIVTLETPEEVGVPEIKPVVVLMLKPVGRPVAP